MPDTRSSGRELVPPHQNPDRLLGSPIHLHSPRRVMDPPASPAQPVVSPPRHPTPAEDPPLPDIRVVDEDSNTGGNTGGPEPNPSNDNGNEAEQGADDAPSEAALFVDFAKAITQLSAAISGLGDSSSTGGKTNVRNPDVFDGKDPKKLPTFLSQCRINFRDRPKAFRDDRQKVNYAISYLKDSALTFFTPTVETDFEQPWQDHWPTFVKELERNFGVPDPVGAAVRELNQLEMKSTDRIATYIVEFNRLSGVSQWPEAPLVYRFYEGLPDRLKDEVTRGDGKPRTLFGMVEKAQNADNRYWERQEERARHDATRPKPQSNQIDNKGQSKPSGSGSNNDNKSSSSSNQNKNSNKDKGQQSSSSSGNNNKSDDKSSILGKDGKLTEAERNRRKTMGLCLFCGKTGHRASDCRAAKVATAARAAKVTESSGASASESKN